MNSSVLKTLSLLAAVFVFSASDSARAEGKIANLTATNKMEITIRYDRQTTIVMGDSRTTMAKDMIITVASPNNGGSPGNAVRAVFMNQCRTEGSGGTHASELVYTCDLKMGRIEAGVPAAHVPSECTVTARHQDTVEYMKRLGGILISSEHHTGSRTQCSQQIAVVVDDNWLVDAHPGNSGNTNFNLQL